MEEAHPTDGEGARSFWEDADVDDVFNRVSEYLEQLRCSLKGSSATHHDYVQGLRMVRLVEAGLNPPDDVITPEVLSSQEEQAPSTPLSKLLLHSTVPTVSSSSGGSPTPEEEQETGPCREEILVALKEQEEEEQEDRSATQALYQPHQCSKACLPSLPRTSQPFWGQNPLKVPLLCGFRRLAGGQEVTSPEPAFIAPCGLRLRSHDDVMHFLFATESYDVLRVEFFTFNSALRLDPPLAAGPRLPELDLSRGLEPTPVELCPGAAGARPRDFRYRKDRWPHGCFLSASPALFHTCCDCQDGCLDAGRCACRGRSPAGQHYTHHTLPRPLEAGLFECGPWCGCDRAKCQNRLVQQGVRVRLQIFQNSVHGGWGVRCRDDLEQGTFICTYAGLVLKKGRDPEEAPPLKRLGAEPPSDDDVEVVTEWLALPPTDMAPPTSSPLHVPVIHRPPEPPSLTSPITPQQSPQNQETQTQHTQPSQNQETQTQHTQPSQNQETQTQHTQPSQNQETQTLRTQETQTQKTQNQETQIHPKEVQDREGRETLDGCLATGAPFPGRGTGQSGVPEEVVVMATCESGQREVELERRKRKREEDEDVYYLDATEEGNVARFLNHSCRPNLFTQSVFTDTQDPCLPLIAFFTSRVIKAGTELTWKSSPDTGSDSPGQEVACQCADCEGDAGRV